MKVSLGSSETSVLTRATRRNIPEAAILRRYHLSLSTNAYMLLKSDNEVGEEELEEA
jgi:hypothetical protein